MCSPSPDEVCHEASITVPQAEPPNSRSGCRSASRRGGAGTGAHRRASVDGVHFPLGEYNARIPREFVERVMHRAVTDVELPAPWSEHFLPAAEDDLLALLPGAG